jgi:FkbH-like protein
MNNPELRQTIDRLIVNGDSRAASRLLTDLCTSDNAPASSSFVVHRYEQLRHELRLQPYRLAILRSFTVEPLVPMIRAAAFGAGLDLSVHLSDFNSYVQEIVDSQSSLYRFAPDAVFLAVQTRDIAPELWRDFADLDEAQVRAVIDRVTSDCRNWISNFRRYSNAHLVVHTFEEPEQPSSGLLDCQTTESQTGAIEHINRELRKIAGQYSGVYVLDYDALIARHGRATWHDERKWITVRMPMATNSLNVMAKEWLRFLHPLAGKVAKALVVDLDNTLWGGVVGEEGLSGIKLGSEYPGAAFRDVQRALLDLHQRGILLAICSKNNEDDAMEVLQRHPGMLLKPSDFASIRLNWEEKATNLVDIARELNIGVDALAFLDDNPIERAQVRSRLPEVHVIDLPAEPIRFARFVRECPLFERLTLSKEDKQRGAMYQAQQERERLEHNVTSREDFFRSLEQEAEIAPLTGSSAGRIAQLTTKTNQFNLTTKRYAEQQIFDLVASGSECFSLRVRDRFGDNGIVGVAITRCAGEACEIDTFLLSCRVIGRTVETAFLSFLVQHASKQGAKWMQGWFRQTAKNAPAKDFFPNHGFKLLRQQDGGDLWSLDLSTHSIYCPEWIKLNVINGDKQR